ncbi:MAG: rhodanese-like domain-containing protein, partial [Chryseobacterium sp.]|nr:rhodanese-like domain-containing protein [Chryseobacterium sp.]
VYPSHGAGSACGKNMSKETTDTLGNQKKTNYALRSDMTKEDFIAELTDGLALPPAYFPQNVQMNIAGYQSLDFIIEKSLKALNPIEFQDLSLSSDVIVLDVRHEDDFVKAHIPNSIFVGIQGNFAPWVGAIIGNVNQKLIIVAPNGKEQETITRLSRVGFDHVLGYLDGEIEEWKKAGFVTESVKSISPEEFAKEYSNETLVIDARKPGEFKAEHVENALNFPLDAVHSNFKEIEKNKTFYLHCAGGYRSVIMASVLKSNGLHHFINVEKGMNGIKTTLIPTTNFVCQSTIK